MSTHFYANKATKYVYIIPPDTIDRYTKIKFPKNKIPELVKVLQQWKKDLCEGFFTKGKYALIQKTNFDETRCVLGVLLSQLDEVDENYFNADKIRSEDLEKIFGFRFVGFDSFQKIFIHLNEVYDLSFIEIAKFLESLEKYLLDDTQKFFYYSFDRNK